MRLTSKTLLQFEMFVFMLILLQGAFHDIDIDIIIKVTRGLSHHPIPPCEIYGYFEYGHVFLMKVLISRSGAVRMQIGGLRVSSA